MRRVHREGTERVGAHWLGRKSRWKQGLAYRRTEETALCSTGHVRNGILFIGRALVYRKRRKQTPYSRNGGPIHREGCGIPQNGTPRDTVHLHHRPPPASTGYHRPPPASTGYRRPPPASTGSCSSSLHRALLHRLLFNNPSTGTPPTSTVHPALHTTGSCSSRGNAITHCSSQRQHRSASVSSSREGIARSGSVNSHRSIARVQ